MANVKELMISVGNGISQENAHRAIKGMLWKEIHAFETRTSLHQVRIAYVLNGRIEFA